ncbi:Uncharacterized conserved protein, DUF488 family [Sphaerochaeta associata]|nr:Uncharacterized conserved protein, DUF488 family [Sphaerochaeta associata]
MLYRRKVFLNLVLRHKKPLSLVRLQALMFLLVKSTGNAYYDFIPHTYGCYSISLYNDQEALTKQDVVIEARGDSPFNSFLSVDNQRVELDSILLKDEDSPLLDKLICDSEHQSDDDLLERVLKAYPFYAIRSLLLDRFSSDQVFISKIQTIRDHVTSAPRYLYTIGYEGLSIDGFLQSLILQNIKTLVDVRKSAFSMRPEFRKKNLEAALMEAGIQYYPMPEVGIPASNRKELLPSGRRCDLFKWYSENTLPLCERYASVVARLVSRENIALMCYEKDPKDCHRSLFAEYCQRVQPSIPGIKHLGEAGVYTSSNVSNTWSI